MNKSELVDAMSQDAGVTKADAARILESFMNTVTGALKNGDQVVLTGFGSFSTGDRAARTGRDPRTGKEIEIRAARVAKFKVGKLLKEAVNV